MGRNSDVTASSTPYGAADGGSQELSSWTPPLGAPNSEYLWDRDAIVARTRDLVRNSGWAAGAVTRWLDNIIGASFRLSVRPDFMALGLSPGWAKTWATDVEGKFRLFAEDPDNWMDAARHDKLSGILGLGVRHEY